MGTRPDPYRVVGIVGLAMAALVALWMYLLHSFVEGLLANTPVLVLEVLGLVGFWFLSTFYMSHRILRRHYPDIFR